MRKLFLTASVALLTAAVMAGPPVQVFKEKGGLFGYETVTQVSDGSFITLHCQGRGLIKCRLFSGSITVGDNDEVLLTDSDISLIEKQIGEQTSTGNTSGIINYAEKVVIKFDYNKSIDRLVYTIYSIPQAIQHSII